jgi:hypothetical protein
MKVFNKINKLHKTFILLQTKQVNSIKYFSSINSNLNSYLYITSNNKANYSYNNNNFNINNNIKKINKKFFSQEITNNQKLKKKFYKKSQLIKLDIPNYKNFLKINELYLDIDIDKEEESNKNNNKENKDNNNNNNNNNNIDTDKDTYIYDNDIDIDIDNNLLENFTRKNLQKKLYNIKTKNLGFNYEKNFDKFNILFNGSLFHKEYFGILLDGRRCKSMHLDELKIPSKKLAIALALEWQSQKDLINFHKMHLYFHISNGIRISKDHYYRKNTVDKIISFFPTDQIFYFEDIFIEKIKKEENLNFNVHDIINKFKKNFDLDFDFPSKDNKGKINCI